MCGICGAFSYVLSDHEVDIVKQLFICNSVRGLDSSGAFSVYEKNVKGKISHPVIYLKTIFDPTEFIRNTSKSLFNPTPDKQTDLQAIVGHNRLATVGKVSKENAHPFMMSNVSGVHNGTVGHKWGTNAPQFETDSEALYDQINRRGVEEPLKEINDGWSSAYALVFHDRKKHTLNFIRNVERPLAYALHNGTIFFASEPMMLEWILSRNRIHVKPTMFPSHQLHTFHLDDARPTAALDIKDLTPPPRTYSHTSNYGNYGAKTDARKELDDYAPAIQFGYVRVLSGKLEPGEQVAWRRVCYVRDEKPSVIYASKVPKEKDEDKKPKLEVVEGGKQGEQSGPSRNRSLVTITGGKNADQLDFVLDKLAGIKKLDDDVPFEIGSRPDEFDDRTARDIAEAQDCIRGKILSEGGIRETVSRGVRRFMGVEKDADEDAESEDKHDPDDWVFDLEWNCIKYADFDRILADGCGGCGMVPCIDDIWLDDDQVNGLFVKDDTGAIIFKCTESNDGKKCACFPKRQAIN